MFPPFWELSQRKTLSHTLPSFFILQNLFVLVTTQGVWEVPGQEPDFQGGTDQAWVLAQCDFRLGSLSFSEPPSSHLCDGHTHSGHFTGPWAQCLASETLSLKAQDTPGQEAVYPEEGASARFQGHSICGRESWLGPCRAM